MRKVRGWIRNLADGLGPPPGTVEVHARINNEEIDLEEHRLGYLDRTHQSGGAGSPTEADSAGHFGWDMEFSPGPIVTQIIPSDPQTEYRYRFPDESAPVGKAFHSDLERLGWTAGKDCLVWGAIEGVAAPTAASWSADPLVSSGQGDWSIASLGSGVNAGRVTLRRGIGFLGGVVFSVESGDLLVPVAGDDPASPNVATSDRWDLLVASADSNPTSLTYGKQRIVIQEGSPGAGIPALTPVAGERRLVIHALKMAAGGAGYSAASDLRPWSEPVPGMSEADPVAKIWVLADPLAGQVVPPSVKTPSTLNAVMSQDLITLAPSRRWIGRASYSCWVNYVGASKPFMFRFSTSGYSAPGVTVPGTDYVLKTSRGYEHLTLPPAASEPLLEISMPSFDLPLGIIPSFTANSLAAATRNWRSLGFALEFEHTGTLPVLIQDQRLSVQFLPIP